MLECLFIYTMYKSQTIVSYYFIVVAHIELLYFPQFLSAVPECSFPNTPRAAILFIYILCTQLQCIVVIEKCYKAFQSHGKIATDIFNFEWKFYNDRTNTKRVNWLEVQKLGLPPFFFFFYMAREDCQFLHWVCNSQFL